MPARPADIPELVPEMRQRLWDLPPSTTLADPEQARFRLFDAITTFLLTIVQRQPLIVVLDNLHWADWSSLLLLEFLSHEMA